MISHFVKFIQFKEFRSEMFFCIFTASIYFSMEIVVVKPNQTLRIRNLITISTTTLMFYVYREHFIKTFFSEQHSNYSRAVDIIQSGTTKHIYIYLFTLLPY